MTTALEKMRGFVASFPQADMLDGFTIDFTNKLPDNGGLFPNGLIELDRVSDILGNTTVYNQYNFALYTVLTKAPGDDEGATDNAEWLMDFQEWVQEQSAKHLAPTFGDDPKTERITAQNGAVFSADEEGTAIYVVQISVSFRKDIR